VRVVQMTAGQGGSVAASVLAAWGADVIDASPRAGAGERSGLGGSRRRIFVDVAREEGYTVLLELITGADVFLTDLDDEVRGRLRIDLADLRSVNPELVYARCPTPPAYSPEDLEAVAIAGAVAAGLLRRERIGGLQLVEWPIVGRIRALDEAHGQVSEPAHGDGDRGDEILAEVGFDPDSIAELRARGVLG